MTPEEIDLRKKDIRERVESLRKEQTSTGFYNEPAEKDLANDLMRLTPHLDFSTEKDGAVFYTDSNRTYQADARWHAEVTGKRTIEMTRGGAWLNDLKLSEGVLDQSNRSRVWQAPSERFAEGASGQVHYFGPKNPSEDSTLAQHELPALRSNPKVTSVVHRDKKELRQVEKPFEFPCRDRAEGLYTPEPAPERTAQQGWTAEQRRGVISSMSRKAQDGSSLKGTKKSADLERPRK